MEKKLPQLDKLLLSTEPQTVFHEIRRIFSFNYNDAYFDPIEDTYLLIKHLFDGTFKGYKGCNTDYHNFNHTIDTTLATMRLIDGYNLSSLTHFSLSTAVNLLIASLFHDTGYIQTESDIEGTGAKYTLDHVKRSVELFIRHHEDFGIDPAHIDEISKFIFGTDLGIDINTIPYSSDEQRISTYILATGDLISQMADRTYLEKLLFLYYEFREAGISGYNTEFDILKKTVSFYDIIKVRLSDTLHEVFSLAKNHFEARFEIDHNLYIEEMEKNIEYLNGIIEDDKSNFRGKLKRWDPQTLNKYNFSISK